MVIPSSSSHVVSIRFISKALICLSSILVLLSTTTCAIYEGDEFENNIKSATFVSETFEVGPGTVAEKTLQNIDFPRGHIGVKSFNVEVVDKEGNSVPLYEAYLHHWFAIRYYEKIWSMSPIPKDPKKPYDGIIFKRNEGTCNGPILPHYWGFGSESRGTSTKIPDPYAVELGNPEYTPPGYEEKWLFNLMVIDTRGTKHRKGCTQCRCDLFNLPENFFNVTTGIDGKPLDPGYKGGLFCCKDNFQCKLKKDFEAPKRMLALRYKITWVDWNQHQIPLRFYILDATDRVRTNGSNIIHDCQAEYTISKSDYWEKSPHVQKANIPMEKGGYLIYATSHVHSGVINTTLYRQDGKTLCTSKPKYGKGKEPGNEKGYVVGMSVCYPEPGSIKIKDGETLTLESRYKRHFITGAMGHTYIYLADRLPLNEAIPYDDKISRKTVFFTTLGTSKDKTVISEE